MALLEGSGMVRRAIVTCVRDLALRPLTLRMPVRRDDRFLGLMIVAVALGDLSRFLSELYVDEGLSAFVLYDRDHVLAHQALLYKEFNFAEQEGLLMCPEGAATYAAYRQELASGRISPDEEAVLFNCANGNKYPLPDRARRMRLAEMDVARL